MKGVEIEQPLKLHFIPYLSPGHMIPLCDIATLFASRGQQVTITTTPLNSHFFTNKSPFFRLHIVDFPSLQVGLPDGVESLSSTTDHATSIKIYTAAKLLLEPIGDLMQKDPPDYIIADCIYPGVYDMAHKLQIPILAFTVFSLFTVSLLESLRTNHLLHSHMDLGSFVVPNFPHRITLCTNPPKAFTEVMETMLEAILKSNGLIVNNFAELDGQECVKHYEKTTGHKAWHLGPASLIHKTVQEKADRGNESVVNVQECLSWLNSKRDNSVLYICFGSICYFSDKQLYEISCGIEASGHEFVWVIPEKKGKEDESDEDKQKWLPSGFEERNIGRKKKGLIIRGWAPQVMIMSHNAVGAFMTHCGWNSVVEAVSAGIPMITWPLNGEHFYNEKLITDVHGIGVEVGATDWSMYVIDEKKVVSRDSIKNAVRRLMDGGIEAEEIRRRSQELGEKARLAVQQGGSSNNNLLTLIEDLTRLKHIRKPLH
ncbi:putative UDP-glucuronosyl/UDP-glucosyltransferase [Medicago truncatula]|uniref:Glycosyltransferase n=1 Tax=Medicago truncatula TaxID=3880 RepID=G8A0S1_MEDTR|nr:scopoletin glucosyltransferase [Medicago truncatula]KEH25852.1 UDP-glucosyltransferase family protein [Medicago truncatula]RHN51022.1 putative UDP-glucuronosyl/UDP-glucosyltransferase [Medicago truncatula]